MCAGAASWGVAVTGGAALVVSRWLQPAFRTHDESVRHVPQQRGAAFCALGFTRSCEEHQTPRVCSASVTVDRVDGRQIHGQTGCESRACCGAAGGRSAGPGATGAPSTTASPRGSSGDPSPGGIQ